MGVREPAWVRCWKMGERKGKRERERDKAGGLRESIVSCRGGARVGR